MSWKDELPVVAYSQDDSAKSGVVITGDSDGIIIPAMSAEEVANSVSTRGKKMVKVEAPEGVRDFEFAQVISGAYLCFTRHGQLPSPSTVHDVIPELPMKKITLIMEHPLFRRAMLIRGIDFSSQSGLTPEQEMAIAIMATPDGKSFSQKLKQAGVAPSKWRAWLKTRTFRAEWDLVGGSLLRDFETDMLVALVGSAVNGNQRAIEYAFEVSGRHAPKQAEAQDSQVLMAKFIEILQEEIKDLDLLTRIAARMSMVSSSRSHLREIATGEFASIEGGHQTIEG